jgi:hypothetical protein
MKTRLTVGFCLAALLLAGCKSTMKPADTHVEDNPYLQQGRIQFENSTMGELIHIARVDTERVNGGMLKVIVTVRNLKKDNFWSEFRTTFLDERGHVLEQTNWEPIELNARTLSEYTCTSINSRAADYQIVVRNPAKTTFDRR